MSLLQIGERYPNEIDAIVFFEKMRWGDEIKCPYCNSTSKGVRHKDYRYSCKNCERSYSATTGTVLHNTRLPLKKWLMAIELFIKSGNKISALQLSKDINVTYKTGWAMHHKIRELTCSALSKNGETQIPEILFEEVIKKTARNKPDGF